MKYTYINIGFEPMGKTMRARLCVWIAIEK